MNNKEDKVKADKPTEDATPKKVVKKATPKKAKYTFIKPFKTQNESFKVGDPCFYTHKNIIEFLLTTKTIK